ncbi:MAG TPA: tetratricopeptide repeat protein [Myxococcales bacterium]|nr:tetratricopeptide repeat protein [Myxococcales bacterium]
MSDSTSPKKRAMALWKEGEHCHLQSQLERAVELYGQSIKTYPTAEAHTFRGWAYFHLDRVDDAIFECRTAISVDPTLGNPYNDIGSYLIFQGRDEEAIQWFELAKSAPRYEPRHFPYMNLGRLFARRGLILRAVSEFENALEYCPNESYCVEVLAKLKACLN